MGLKKERKWKPDYSWVLVANAIYILFFLLNNEIIFLSHAII